MFLFIHDINLHYLSSLSLYSPTHVLPVLLHTQLPLFLDKLPLFLLLFHLIFFHWHLPFFLLINLFIFLLSLFLLQILSRLFLFFPLHMYPSPSFLKCYPMGNLTGILPPIQASWLQNWWLDSANHETPMIVILKPVLASLFAFIHVVWALFSHGANYLVEGCSCHPLWALSGKQVSVGHQGWKLFEEIYEGKSISSDKFRKHAVLQVVHQEKKLWEMGPLRLT